LITFSGDDKISFFFAFLLSSCYAYN